MQIFIKNMVCNRCIAVEDVFRNSEIDFVSVNLGWVETSNDFSKNKLQKLNENLQKIGFEILENASQTNRNHQKTHFRKSSKFRY
jgi:16S rRNA C967 or C1407 C5-methylase (RsmB/RsmF family)